MQLETTMIEGRQKLPYKWIVMSVIGMGTLMSTLDMGGIQVILPHLEQYFGTGPDVVVWISLIWVLVGSSLMLSMGRASDIFGRKRLYTLGFAVFILGLVLCPLSGSIIQLIIFRFIQSIGAAITIAIGNAILASAFPAGERGRALGIMGAVGGLGLLVGPALGGFCLDLLGWRSFFYLRIPFTAVGLGMSQLLLKEQAVASGSEKFDIPGAVTLFFSLVFLLLTLTQGRSLGWASPLILIFGSLGIVLIASFIVIETKILHPVLDLKMFKNRLFSIAVVSHLFLYASTIAVNFLMPFYLIDGLGINAGVAGLVLITIPAFTLVLSPWSGTLSDRYGTQLFCTAGFILICTGLFLLNRLHINSSIGVVLLYLIVVSVGMGLFVTPNTSAIMTAVPGGRLSSASAMIGTLRHIGMSVGLAIAGSAFTAGRSSKALELASEGSSPDMIKRLSTTGGFQSTIIIALVIASIGLLTSVLRGKSRQIETN